MRFAAIIVVLFLCAASLAAEKSRSISKKDRQAAEQEFKHALELEKSGQLEGALQAAVHATQLSPDNAAYLTGREMLRQRIVSGYLDRGNAMAAKGDLAGAAAPFRQALAMDPENSYLMHHLPAVSTPAHPHH